MKNTEQTYRWIVTHVRPDGFRSPTFANQGRYHHLTKDAAEAALKAVLANNAADHLSQVYGPAFATTVRADRMKTYDSGDIQGDPDAVIEYHPALDLKSSPADRLEMARAIRSIGGTVVEAVEEKAVA